MKRFELLLAFSLTVTALVVAQEEMIAPPENMVVENISSIPASLAETIGPYTENREAFVSDWHPTRREMLIGTRFANTYQAHLVKMPGGARQQLTFFHEPVYGGSFCPKDGSCMVYSKDVGGGEWFQFFRYDMATGNRTLLTDGKSRNTAMRWSTVDSPSSTTAFCGRIHTKTSTR